MSDKTPPIPPDIWLRLIEFLESGRSGKFSFNISEGRVLNADVHEHVVAGAPVPRQVAAVE